MAAIHEIDIRLEEIEFKIQEGQQLEQSRHEFMGQLPTLDKFTEWLWAEDPEYIHRQLAAFLVQIIVHPEKKFDPQWRE